MTMQTMAICCISENRNDNNGVKCVKAYTDQLVLRNQYCLTKHVLNSINTSVQAEDKSYPSKRPFRHCSVNKKWLIIPSTKLTFSVSTNN